MAAAEAEAEAEVLPAGEVEGAGTSTSGEGSPVSRPRWYSRPTTCTRRRAEVARRRMNSADKEW